MTKRGKLRQVVRGCLRSKWSLLRVNVRKGEILLKDDRHLLGFGLLDLFTSDFVGNAKR